MRELQLKFFQCPCHPQRLGRPHYYVLPDYSALVLFSVGILFVFV